MLENMRKAIAVILVCAMLITLVPAWAAEAEPTLVGEVVAESEMVFENESSAESETVIARGTLGEGGAPWRLYANGAPCTSTRE